MVIWLFLICSWEEVIVLDYINKGSQFKEIFRYISDYSQESESILLRIEIKR